MSQRLLALALKKQRLQFRSAALRSEFAAYAAAWTPAFNAADRVREGVIWLRDHRIVPIALAVALVVARPRAVFRWARRGITAWRILRRVRSLLEPLLPVA